MIGVVDYGIGNVAAFLNCFELVDEPAFRVTTPEDLHLASGLILPGVGSFDLVMTTLRSRGFIEPLNERVLEAETPVLGVCVGMQIMGLASEEGIQPGLGWVETKASSLRTDSSPSRLVLPHMGWNQVSPTNRDGLFDGFQPSEFYFLHSFGFLRVDPPAVAAFSTYGQQFVSAVVKGNIFGVQFHPEKSHEDGLRLLANFADIVRNA